MVHQFMVSLSALLVETCAARVEHSNPIISAHTALTTTLDSSGVCAVLRAAGQNRSAEQVESAVKQHSLIQLHSGLSLGIGDEVEGWQQWGERPPSLGNVAQGLQEREKFVALALGDFFLPVAPKAVPNLAPQLPGVAGQSDPTTAAAQAAEVRASPAVGAGAEGTCGGGEGDGK